jgi:flagellin
MALNVISNFAANVAHRQLIRSDMQMTDSLAKLSSGTRVVSAKDDAASMAIGSRLRGEVNALTQAAVNSGQAVSMLQVADGAMSRIHDILVRMKTLGVQAGSGQLSAIERGMLNTEYQQLISEIDRIALDTEFNGNQLVSGTLAVSIANATDFEPADGVQSLTFKGSFNTASQATIAYNSTSRTFTVTHNGSTYSGSLASGTNNGTSMLTGTVVSAVTGGTDGNKIDIAISTAFVVNANHASGTLGLSGSATSSFTYKVGTGTSASADDLTVAINALSVAQLGLTSTDVTSAANANLASAAISSAVDTLNTARANIGAIQNRLEFAAANIATTMENMEAARSNLLDLDVAAEMTKFTSRQILVQSGIAMLAQANQTPQNLLRLFQQ